MGVQTGVSLPSSVTLSRTAERARKLLRGLAGLPRLLEALRRAGYTPEEAALGVSLSAELHRLQVSGSAEVLPANAALDAQRELSGEGMLFVRAIGAAMLRVGSPAALRIADAVDASAPPAFAVDAVLGAIDAVLEAGGAEALAIDAALSRRAYGAERRAEMRQWVRLATGQVLEVAPVGAPNGLAPAVADRIAEVQVALYRWWQEWSIVARARATSRRELILLGLAQPRRRATAEVPVDADLSPTAATPAADRIASAPQAAPVRGAHAA